MNNINTVLFQVISGNKIFENTVLCENISVAKNAAFKEVNNLNISSLYKKLIFNKKDHKITGQKTFVNGFKAFMFHSKGKLTFLIAL